MKILLLSAYPVSDQQQSSVEPLILNIYTALAADRVLFNTGYNRQAFLEGVERLLKKLPDFVPADIIPRLFTIFRELRFLKVWRQVVSLLYLSVWLTQSCLLAVIVTLHLKVSRRRKHWLWRLI